MTTKSPRRAPQKSLKTPSPSKRPARLPEPKIDRPVALEEGLLGEVQSRLDVYHRTNPYPATLIWLPKAWELTWNRQVSNSMLNHRLWMKSPGAIFNGIPVIFSKTATGIEIQ